MVTEFGLGSCNQFPSYPILLELPPPPTTTVVRIILSTLSDPLGKQLSTGRDHNVFRRSRQWWIKIRRDMGGYRIDCKNRIYLLLPKRQIPAMAWCFLLTGAF